MSAIYFLSWKHIVACGLCLLLIAYCLALEYTYFGFVIFQVKSQVYPPTHQIAAHLHCTGNMPYPPPMSIMMSPCEKSSGRIPTVEN